MGSRSAFETRLSTPRRPISDRPSSRHPPEASQDQGGQCRSSGESGVPLPIQSSDGADAGDLLCVRVHNLPESAIEPEIRALFLPHGTVVAYARPRDGMTSHIGRTAYIGMARPEATAAVRVLDGKRLRGEVLEMSLVALPAGWASGQRQPGSPVPRRTVTPQEARPGRGTSDA